MSILFSQVTLTADKKQIDFLVMGIQKNCDDLKGWIRFEKFLNELDRGCTIEARVNTYTYGEGVEFIATPEEVAYMTIRKEKRPDFLETRCEKREETHFIIEY